MTLSSRGRVLLVGEAPSESSDPHAPLSGRVGARIEHLAHLRPGSLGRHFDLVNLLDRWPGRTGKKGSDFPAEAAREAAKRLAILLEAEPAHRRVIFLGKRVAAAFGERKLEPCRWVERSFGGRAVEVAMIPHPSGVNRALNDPDVARAVGEFLFEASTFGEED